MEWGPHPSPWETVEAALRALSLPPLPTHHSAQQAAAIAPTHEFGKRKWAGLIWLLWGLSRDLAQPALWVLSSALALFGGEGVQGAQRGTVSLHRPRPPAGC